MKELSTSYLKVKRRRLIKKLPDLVHILRGSLLERYKPCGKTGCKCSKGKGHGPKYYLSISRYGKSPQVDYVAQSLKEKVVEYIANYRQTQDILEEICQINLELLRRKEKF